MWGYVILVHDIRLFDAPCHGILYQIYFMFIVKLIEQIQTSHDKNLLLRPV